MGVLKSIGFTFTSLGSLIALISTFSFVCASIDYNRIYLYRGHNFSDTYISIYFPIQNLTEHDFDNKAHSIKYNGTWVLYEHANYNADADGLVIWRNSSLPQESLVLERLSNSGIGGKVSSIRPVGAVDNRTWEIPMLTLYTGNSFTGIDTKNITTYTPRLDFPNPKSLIIIGKGVSWTFYEEIDYNGIGHCLSTRDLVNFYPNIEVLGFPLNLTQSIEVGCWARHGIPLPPSSGYISNDDYDSQELFSDNDTI